SSPRQTFSRRRNLSSRHCRSPRWSMRFAAWCWKAQGYLASRGNWPYWRRGASAGLRSRSEFSDGDKFAEPSAGMAVHRIIEANAAKYGDAPAISDQQVTLSYRELNLRANAVARHL